MSNVLSDIRRRGLTATQLKVFAAATMFVDHLTYTFLECTLNAGTGEIMAYSSPVLRILDLIGRGIGRQAFPIFAFFIAEGFYHTRSRAHYLGRLLLFTVISQFPFHLMCYTGPVGTSRTAGLNVYATLALGLAAIWILDAVFLRYLPPCRLRSLAGLDGATPLCPGADAPVGSPEDASLSSARPYGQRADASSDDVPGPAGQTPAFSVRLLLRGAAAAAAIAGTCRVAVFFNTDYDYIGVIAIVLFCLLRGRRNAAVWAVWMWLTLGSGMEFFALPGLLLLTLYNGERGGRAGTGKRVGFRHSAESAGAFGNSSADAGGHAEIGKSVDAGGRGSAAGKYAFYLFYPLHMVVLWALRIVIFGS